ncbi:hypothetical protein JRO89_XS13G0184500 [Xanthoceras sorbifolium]|uniref:Polynucleotide 5'-hydroxyl-kinase NOL9 n=1 Tax=Xanthoceras sorbifolium TaxID=99658 RepID=A0ABQ8H8Z6_9ROSI|nr:hypothetical protein JRO89_XS13G0184500 [Xanthoceras sorbifolium]
MAAAYSSGAENSSPDIYIPQEWSDAADSIAYDSNTSPPPIALICGAKNCGKTTFSRHLPEFTAPGFLSLTVVDKLTPDFLIDLLIIYGVAYLFLFPKIRFDNSLLEDAGESLIITYGLIFIFCRSFYFGDVSSKRDPTAYLKYIFALYDYYRKEYWMLNKSESPGRTELPLVVNTPGWVKGIGYDILVDLLKYITPTHVIKINISFERKNLPAGAFWLDGNCNGDINLIEVNSARQDAFNRSVLIQKDARLLRDLRIMAYFRQCFPSTQNITTIKELAHALTSHPPYEVSISSIKIRHLYCQVPSSEIFYSLNATIVGLAISSDSSENLPLCVGLGIVRGIDTLKSLLYVITPVSPSILEKVDLFLQGFIQIPTSLLQVSDSPQQQYLVLNTIFWCKDVSPLTCPRMFCLQANR